MNSYSGQYLDTVQSLLDEIIPDGNVGTPSFLYEGINTLYEVETEHYGTCIIKIHAVEKRQLLFKRTAWILQRVKQAGIPAPLPLAVGTANGHAYLIYKKIEGISADNYTGDVTSLWQSMGAYTRQIHTIDAPGYGKLKYWEDHPLPYYNTWTSYIDSELQRIFQENKRILMPYISDAVISSANHNLQEMKHWQFEPKIQHGNVDVKNVIVDPSGSIQAFIDWDDAVFACPPAYELAQTLPWMDNNDHIHAFLNGYGISASQLTNMETHIELIHLLTLFDYLLSAIGYHDERMIDDMRRRIDEII